MSVYFAQKCSGGLIKIGQSRSVSVRMHSLQAKMIGALPGGRVAEKAIHERFAHLRVRGEWFEPSDELLAYISAEAQEHCPDTEMVPTALRCPVSFWARIDKLAEEMSRPGMRITRTEVLRLAAFKGVEALEEERKK